MSHVGSGRMVGLGDRVGSQKLGWVGRDCRAAMD